MALSEAHTPYDTQMPTQQIAGQGYAVAVWLVSVAVLVVIMVAVGGATRLTDSGLSITEWKPILGAVPPITAQDWQVAFEKYKQIPEYLEVNAGMSLAAFKFIYWWEWGHRFLGRFIGLAYALPLFYFLWAGHIPPRARAALLAILGLGALQGFIGWYMVQSGLTERVDVSHYRLAMHLTLAFVILAALVWMAMALRPRTQHLSAQSTDRRALARSVVLCALLLLQVILGAFVAGTKAGLTYNTWPLMDGDWVPPGLWQMTPWFMNFLENTTTIQFTHRALAYVVIAWAIVHAVLSSRSNHKGIKSGAWVLVALFVAQAGLGIWTLLAVDGRIPIGLGVAHQTGAAIVLAYAVYHIQTIRLTRR